MPIHLYQSFLERTIRKFFYILYMLVLKNIKVFSSMELWFIGKKNVN